MASVEDVGMLKRLIRLWPFHNLVITRPGHHYFTEIEGKSVEIYPLSVEEIAEFMLGEQAHELETNN